MATRSALRVLALCLPFTLAASACSIVVHDGAGATLDLGEKPAAVPPGLTPSGPVRCTNNDELRVEGLYITGPGPLVYAGGNCDIWIVGSTLDADGVAVRVDGNGDVTIRESDVRGTQAAFVINGNGDIHVAGSTLVGRREIVGNGQLFDEGGNTFH